MGKFALITETDAISMYSPCYDGEQMHEFAKFLVSNRDHSHPQLKKFFYTILAKIHKMEECGARENLFRPEGGKIKAMPLYVELPRINRKVGKLRLYCIRISERLLILGNGGVTTVNKYEDDPFLLSCVGNLRTIEKKLRREVKKAGTDYDDFDAVKQIIETVNI
ncbi:MAG: hypothetical protein K2G80_06470 [Bacteroidales bacterium]|nr:hypothetical protein [Bacteroidales bacterium]